LNTISLRILRVRRRGREGERKKRGLRLILRLCKKMRREDMCVQRSLEGKTFFVIEND
jgi:hypothetical protein